MMVYSPVSTCMKNVLILTGSSQRQMSNRFYDITLQAPSGMCCFHICTGQPKLRYTTVSASNANSSRSIIGSQASRWSCFSSSISKQNSRGHTFKIDSVVNPRSSWKTRLDFSLRSRNMNLRLLVPNQAKIPKIKYSMRPGSWHQRYGPAGLFIGLLVCYSFSEPAHAEAPDERDNQEDDSDSSSACYSHGKKVYTDYSVIGIPGDGRCLFRSVAHGACLRSGKPAPDEILQRALADELRAKVADEFVRRREETEWFIEGNFDTYVSQIRKPHVWGGEPELLMASHVLQMPITVYMHDQDSGGLISIAEYGQEYGKDNPIKVLYHGFGHYDALQIPGKKGARSRL